MPRKKCVETQIRTSVTNINNMQIRVGLRGAANVFVGTLASSEPKRRPGRAPPRPAAPRCPELRSSRGMSRGRSVRLASSPSLAPSRATCEVPGALPKKYHRAGRRHASNASKRPKKPFLSMPSWVALLVYPALMPLSEPYTVGRFTTRLARGLPWI